MNEDVLNLLRRITDLLPNLTRALETFTLSVRGVVGSFGRLLGSLTQLLSSFLVARLAVMRPVTALASAGAPPIPAQTLLQQFIQWFARTNVGQTVAGFIARHYQGVMATASAVGGVVRGGMAVGQAALSAIGAAVASPLGQVALAAAGVAVAFTALGAITEKTFRTLLESQRHLAEVSPNMALTFAQSDLRRITREMKAGEDQAGSAGFLARGLDSLADTLQPILSLLTNIANVVGGIVVRIVDWIVTPISYIVEAINSFFKWIKDHWPWGDDDAEGEPIALSEWLDGVAAEAQRRRQPARP